MRSLGFSKMQLSIFNDSMFNGQFSMFNDQWAIFNGQFSIFNGQCSMFNYLILTSDKTKRTEDN